MAYWEFLLQKEGDRSWLPLESPDVEILEGRYRVVARSSRPQVPVEICISHITIDEMPPKRRVQKRSARTNQDGLMVVIPFTRLQSGIWELRCMNDLMADFIGDSWQYSVTLQVLPQDADVEDWSPTWRANADEVVTSTPPAAQLAFSSELPTTPETGVQQPLAPAASSAAAPLPEPEPKSEPETETETEPEPPLAIPTVNWAPTAAKPTPSPIPEPVAFASPSQTDPDESTLDPLQLRQLAEQISQQVVDDAFEAFHADWSNDRAEPAEIATEATTETAIAAESPDSQAEPLYIDGHPLQIQLDTDAYITRLGTPIQLSGRIFRAAAPETNLDPATLPDSQLRIRLFDPQTSRMIEEVQQTMVGQALPTSFSLNVTVPPQHHTHLVLGEILLTTAVAGQRQASPPQAFSITADLNELLGAIADAAEVEAAQPLEPPQTVEPSPSPKEVQLAEQPDGEEASAAPSRNLAFMNFRQSSKQPTLFQPSIGMGLPPQIRRADTPGRTTATGPQLPVLPIPSTPEPSWTSEATDPEATDSEITETDAAGEVIDSEVTETDATSATIDEVVNTKTNTSAKTNPLSAAATIADPTSRLEPDQPLAEETAIQVSVLEDSAPEDSTLENSTTDPAETQVTVAEEPLNQEPLNAEHSLENAWDVETELAVTDLAGEAIAADPLTPSSESAEAEEIDECQNQRDAADSVDSLPQQTDDASIVLSETAWASPLDQAFQSLNLQGRFLSRLSALASETQEESLNQVRSQPPQPWNTEPAQPFNFEALTLQPSQTETQPLATSAPVPPSLESIVTAPEKALSDPWSEEHTPDEAVPRPSEAELTAYEVVIYDDMTEADSQIPTAPVSPFATPSLTPASPHQAASIQPVTARDEDPPVPSPRFDLPPDHLTAGQLIEVNIRLAHTPLKIYVKFWLSDRQARSILEGPHWLVDFSPNGQGELETQIQFTVPHGCLELQLEATTVEVATQRESEKTSISRAVIPPDLPPIIWDEFDL